MNRKVLFSAALMLSPLLAPLPGAGQLPFSARELGMAGAYLGVARGYEALSLAPGNLALPDAPLWSIGMPQISAGATLGGPRFGQLRDFADYDDLDRPGRRELLETIPHEGAEGGFSVRIPFAAFSSGPFALGVSFVGSGRHSASRDVVELMLEGYEEGRSDYRVGDTAGERMSYWDVAAGYAIEREGISIGATAHLLRRGTLVRTRLAEPSIDLEARSFAMDYQGVIARGGSGFALDLGAAIAPTPEWTFSATLSNLLSRISWSGEIGARTITLDRELLDDYRPRGLSSEYRESETRIEKGAMPPEYAPLIDGLFTDARPAPTARLGAAWQPASGTRLAADLHRTLGKGRLSESWDRRLSVGVQQELPIVTLRTGAAFGTGGSRMLAGGLSLGPIEFGVARLREKQSLQRSGWIATFGIGIFHD